MLAEQRSTSVKTVDAIWGRDLARWKRICWQAAASLVFLQALLHYLGAYPDAAIEAARRSSWILVLQGPPLGFGYDEPYLVLGAGVATLVILVLLRGAMSVKNSGIAALLIGLSGVLWLSLGLVFAAPAI